MKLIESVAEMAALGKKWREEGKKVGLVPTMGYLHAGHLSLAKQAVTSNQITVMSIFVNPIQFGVHEDLDQYPRDLSGDMAKAAKVGVDFIFAPKVSEMYPPDFCTTMDLRGITETLCGASRPGHFQGVAVVVTKLFNLVQPANVYFGQKDGQQLAVIRQLAKDLNMPFNIVGVPIVREADGLALSSRNIYLNEAARTQALVLSQSVAKAKALFDGGERSCGVIIEEVKAKIMTSALAEIEYVEIVDALTMEPIMEIKKPAMLGMAVRFNGTRLIDNLLLG